MPLAHAGPGFKPHVLEALRRIHRDLDLAWCNMRQHWIVVRRGAAAQRSYWNGKWHNGWDIVLRWAGIDGVYRAAFPHEKCGFLPLDNRLVLLVRACDLDRRESAAERWREAEEADEDRILWRETRRLDRMADASAYVHSRHATLKSVGGVAPGRANDYETDEEARAEMSGRMRRAMNRVRAGLPPEGKID